MSIRQARTEDISRIAEMMVVNYRTNFYQYFQNDEFYFGELNVLSVANEYFDNPQLLANCYVYDDSAVKGFIRVNGDEVEKLYVEPQFQSQNIGAQLLHFALHELNAKWLWVLERNSRGISFYKKNGFEFSGEKQLEDDWIPLLKMVKV